jgi:AmiR/NasT family two-component response regulator
VQRADLTGRRVLIVEDEFLIALDIEDALGELGCEIIGPAATVADAMRLIEATPPDVAVLDVRLADGSTGPIAEELRRRQVPFVVLTGYERQQVTDELLRASPMLAKPLQRGALAGTLRQLLAA